MDAQRDDLIAPADREVGPHPLRLARHAPTRHPPSACAAAPAGCPRADPYTESARDCAGVHRTRDAEVDRRGGARSACEWHGVALAVDARAVGGQQSRAVASMLLVFVVVHVPVHVPVPVPVPVAVSVAASAYLANIIVAVVVRPRTSFCGGRSRHVACRCEGRCRCQGARLFGDEPPLRSCGLATLRGQRPSTTLPPDRSHPGRRHPRHEKEEHGGIEGHGQGT